MKVARRVAALAAVALLAAGLPALAAADKTELAVYAAASLKEAFADLASAFEKAYPGVKVQLNLAGSQELRTQIEQGARADVFAAADLEHMRALEKQGLVGRPAVFARNEPVIVVPRGNPAAIHALEDLRKTRRLVIGAPEVPIGSYTVRIFEAAANKHGAAFRAQLEAAVASRELNVRQVLAKVTLAEADAGIVYRTDALAAKDKVEVVAIPSELNVIAGYPIATVVASARPALARAWVEMVLSPQGQGRLAALGFLPAPVRAGPPVPAP
jgi:molybdate transport system substrate-binding protein